MVVLHDPVQHCVGHGGGPDPFMPVLFGQLAGGDAAFLPSRCKGLATAPLPLRQFRVAVACAVQRTKPSTIKFVDKILQDAANLNMTLRDAFRRARPQSSSAPEFDSSIHFSHFLAPWPSYLGWEILRPIRTQGALGASVQLVTGPSACRKCSIFSAARSQQYCWRT